MQNIRYACSACGKWFEFEAGDSEKFAAGIDCPFCDASGSCGRRDSSSSGMTGVYKHNKKLRRLIKVSDSIPGLSGGGGSCASCAGGSCSSCGQH